MSALSHLMQLSQSVIAPAGGMQAYMEDMQRVRSVLSTAPEPFSWWTAVLLVLIAVAWLALLTTAWVLLNRRLGRLRAGEAPMPVLAQGHLNA